MALKKVAEIDTAVVAPRSFTTGIVIEINRDSCKIVLDDFDGKTVERTFDRNAIFHLKWTSRRRKGNFIFIARAWIDKRKIRRFRIQSHRIFHDGVIWHREIHMDVFQGIDIIKSKMPEKLQDKING